jgi:multidrug efflux pump subunit AcrA (membrane-fusion protein)
MTQGIINTLNLPNMDELFAEGAENAENHVEIEDDVETETESSDGDALVLQKAQEVLGLMNGKEHGQKTNEIHDQTLKHAQEIVDLSFNVDQRSQRGLLEVAASFYKNALDAANSKRDAELKAMKLALEKRKLDMEEHRMKAELGDKSLATEGVIVENRNDIIRKLIEMRNQAKP